MLSGKIGSGGEGKINEWSIESNRLGCGDSVCVIDTKQIAFNLFLFVPHI